MSDFDRNLATARTGYRTDQVTIDAGLRAHMIRVYNYMTAGVALTGLVAWFTFSAAVTQTGGGLRRIRGPSGPSESVERQRGDPGGMKRAISGLGAVVDPLVNPAQPHLLAPIPSLINAKCDPTQAEMSDSLPACNDNGSHFPRPRETHA